MPLKLLTAIILAFFLLSCYGQNGSDQTDPYEKAYQETLSLTMPEFFWDQIMKAATCGHLERIEEGQACAQALLALKPDFAQRGRVLIGRYIKFEDIVDRIIEGLGKLGMKIA